MPLGQFVQYRRKKTSLIFLPLSSQTQLLQIKGKTQVTKYQCCVEDGHAEDKAKDKAKDKTGQSRSRPRPIIRGQGQGQGRTDVGEKSVANLKISTRNMKYKNLKQVLI